MEIHRLKPMIEDYDREVFNIIYQDVAPLKHSLANQIDPRKFGVDRDIILSWFDDKMLFVFNKHYNDKNPDVLKGYIINSMKTFKYRILRKAYCNEAEYYYDNLIPLEGEEFGPLDKLTTEEEESNHDLFVGLISKFMEDKLSEEAYFLYGLQINLPTYILSRMKKPNSRIPTSLILEYLGLPDTKLPFLKKLKREINKTIKMAKEELTPLAIN